MSDLVERLRHDAHQLTKMVEHAKLAVPETGVRVKDPSLLLVDLSEAAEEIERLRKALRHYADESRWHKTYHRPEVPGPHLPIMWFSENGWETENLEPWAVAADALKEGIEETGVNITITDCVFIGANVDRSNVFEYAVGENGIMKLTAIRLVGWTCYGPDQSDVQDAGGTRGPTVPTSLDHEDETVRGLKTLAKFIYGRFYCSKQGWENWRVAANGKDLIDQLELMTRPEIMENSDPAAMDPIHRSIILGEAKV